MATDGIAISRRVRQTRIAISLRLATRTLRNRRGRTAREDGFDGGFKGGALRQSGIRPCFLGGRDWRLSRSANSARINRGRVSCGSITSSRYPSAAATYGFANFSLYSATYLARGAAAFLDCSRS